MNKQIEEIKKLAETLRLIDELQFDPNYTLSYQRAMCLNKAGYRKASTVAREIADEIKRYLRLNEDISKKCKEENGEKNEEYWKGKLDAFLQIRGYIDTELKKKYESEGER